MKAFDISTTFESNTDYRFDGEMLRVSLADAVRLEKKIYRSIYMSKKTVLNTAIYLKDLSNVTLDFGGATLLLRDDTIQPFLLDGCQNVTIKNVTVEYERSLMNELERQMQYPCEVFGVSIPASELAYVAEIFIPYIS